MNELEKPKAQEITMLHNEIVGHLRQSLEKAIRIGQLLQEQKANLKHGEWGKWIRNNLPFTDRTARNYMRVYQERDRLKTETVSDLRSAYLLLSPSKQVEMFENQDEKVDCFDLGVWQTIIANVNADLPVDERWRIETEPGKFYELMKADHDGSLTDEEMRAFSVWVNFHTHLCWLTNLARCAGTEKLPHKVVKYLEAIHSDKPGWKDQPIGGGICKDGCKLFHHHHCWDEGK